MKTLTRTIIATVTSTALMLGGIGVANAQSTTAYSHLKTEEQTLPANATTFGSPIVEPSKVKEILDKYGVNETETVHEYVEGLGETTTTYDFTARKITLNTKGGTTIIPFSDLTSIIQQGVERVKSGAIAIDENSVKVVSEDQSSVPLPQSANFSIDPNDICPYVVGLVGFGHDAAWNAALSLIGVNPAIAFLVGLGSAAFWIWVSTHCGNV